MCKEIYEDPSTGTEHAMYGIDITSSVRDKKLGITWRTVCIYIFCPVSIQTKEKKILSTKL